MIKKIRKAKLLNSGFGKIKYHHLWIIAIVLLAALVWSLSIYSITSQIGNPFPGFFYNPERIISGFTPKYFTGWQAGLRPWDMILKVDGQNWREIPRLVEEAGIGGELTYTVQRGQSIIEIPVRTMEFTPQIALDFLPGHFFSSMIFLSVGIFVYNRLPQKPLARYLLIYLTVWAIGSGLVLEIFLSQLKWFSYLLIPYAIIAPVAGWVFFWNFPADQHRKNLLARFPIIQGFIVLGVLSIIIMCGVQIIAHATDNLKLQNILVFLTGWPYFSVFGLGSLFFKAGPLVIIAIRSQDRLNRQQAIVMLFGLSIGLTGWFIYLWAPAAIHTVPPARTNLGGIIPAFYPLSIGFAILRYQLLDIRVVIRKGLIYSLLTAALTALFLLLSVLGGYIFQSFFGKDSMFIVLLSALMVAFLFQPIRNRIQLFVDQSFFRREYEVRQTLTNFSRGLGKLRERNEVIQLVLETISQTLEASNACLYLRINNHYKPAGTSSACKQNIGNGDGMVQCLLKNRSPLFLKTIDQNLITPELHDIDAVLAMPLFSNEKLLGILVLSRKRSGSLYNEEDLDLLSILIHNTTLALENALLYEERVSILREQFSQQVAIQEEERRRISRELHDSISPSLASMNIRLRTVHKSIGNDQSPFAVEVDELARQTQENLRDIRRLIYDLRPAVLDELGLVAALQEYTRRYQNEWGILVELNLSGMDSRLPDMVETALFRIIQEALANIAKHAGAEKVNMILNHCENEIFLQVCDNGQGFDTSKPRTGSHIGLKSMQKRVEQFDGSFELISIPGSGTCLNVKIPLSDHSSNGDQYG